jgi:L-arabinose isomerase
VAPELRPGGARREARCVEAARIEAACGVPRPRGGFGAFTDTFEDLDGLPQLPGIAVQRLMADGYGFGAEGDWKTGGAGPALKVMATGLPGGTSFMEDYTYHLARRAEGARRAHARGLPVDRGRAAVVRDPSAVDRRQGATRCASSSTPRRDRRSSSRSSTWATGSGSSPTRSTCPPDRRSCPAARRRGRCGSRARLRDAAEAWLVAGGSHHTVLTRALGLEVIADFAEMAGAGFEKELRWNEAYYHLARGLL